MEWNGNGMEMEIKWKIGIGLNADLYFRQREICCRYIWGQLQLTWIGGGLKKECNGME